jgi:hypothetical protein
MQCYEFCDGEPSSQCPMEECTDCCVEYYNCEKCSTLVHNDVLIDRDGLLTCIKCILCISRPMNVDYRASVSKYINCSRCKRELELKAKGA